MKKYTLRMMALILCLSMIFSLSACGKSGDEGEVSGVLAGFEDETGDDLEADYSSGESTNSGGGDSGNTISKVEGGNTITEQVDLSGKDPFANIPARLKNTTVTFAHFGDEGATEYQKVIKAFTKKTGIKVKLVSYDQNSYVSTVSKQIAAKSAPDVIICNEIFPDALEIAQPIQNLVDLNEEFWDDSVTKATTINGNTYFVNSLKGVWHNIDMCFYNKKLFSDNRITSPKDYYKRGDWTYENLRKCLEQVVKTGNTGGYVNPRYMAASMGNPMLNYEPSTGKFSQNVMKAVSAFEYCATNIQNKLWDPVLWYGNFQNGTIGLYIQSSYGCKYNGWFKDIDQSIIDAVPTPTSYNGQSCKQTESMRCYGVAKGAKNPEGAAYFLRYFLDYDYYKAAGADVFLNSNLEKAYFESIELMSKKGVNYYYDMAAYYHSVNRQTIEQIANKAPSQVSGELNSHVNEYKTVVEDLNKKIATIK